MTSTLWFCTATGTRTRIHRLERAGSLTIPQLRLEGGCLSSLSRLALAAFPPLTSLLDLLHMCFSIFPAVRAPRERL